MDSIEKVGESFLGGYEMKKGDAVRLVGSRRVFHIRSIEGTTVYLDGYVGLGQNWAHITKLVRVYPIWDCKGNRVYCSVPA